MQLKSERELFRQRRRVPWFQWFITVLVLGIGGYVLYLVLLRSESAIVLPNMPTPMPTVTPAPLLLIARAEDAYWSGDIAAAVLAYQQALDLEPNQTEVYVELARLLTFAGRPERAVLMAQEALRRQPENARAWAVLGRAYDWLALPYEALDACMRARELDPTLPEAYAYLAEAYMDVGNWFAANEVMATALELDELNVDVLRNYGYVLENQGNYYMAIEAYRRALELHPHLLYVYMSIGRNTLAVGNLALARDTFKEATTMVADDAELMDRLGWTYLLLGDYDAARTWINRALVVDPIHPDAHAHLATLYYHQRNYEGAIEMFAPAIRYGEARARRRTVFFVITEEDVADATALGQIDARPSAQVLAQATFAHPLEVSMPLRAAFGQTEGGTPVQPHTLLKGQVRLDVMNGHYTVQLSQVPPVPAGKVYMGWFVPLLTPERAQVHTEAFFPAPDGRVLVEGDTGMVNGPPIETYYTLALCYYFLDECDKSRPYIQAALRLDPEDATALQTLALCR